MPVRIVQNDFTHGEIDPQLNARVDLALFSKSAQLMRNVVVTPTGGAKRRFGTTYITDKAKGSNKLVEFDYDDDTKYLLWFRDLICYFYKSDGTYLTSIVTPYTSSMLDNNELRFARTKNSVIITYPILPPKQIIRGGTETTWTLVDLVFKNYPAYDFDQNYNGLTFTLSDPSIGPGKTLTASGGTPFNINHAGGIFIGIGTKDSEENGVAKILTYVSPTVVTANIIQEFGSVTLLGSQSYLGETAWNSTRGYPRSVTFYEGRLVFGGSYSLPKTVFMSVSNDYLNFDAGTGLDNQSIQYPVGADGINVIKHVVSDRSFQIFTGDAEFVSPQIESQPLSPSNTSFRKQSANGTTKTSPVILDNQTLYVKKGGKAIISFIYDNDRGSYQSTTASLLSPQLIKNPIDSAVLAGSETEQADYAIFVNEDGTLAILQTLLEQNIAAWTGADTQGEFKGVTNVGSEIFFIVRRVRANTEYDFLEKLDWDVYTDCTITNSYNPATATITGFDALDSFEVQIKADGYVFEEDTVIAGSLTLDDEVEEASVGLKYTPLIRLNAPQINTQSGSTLYIPKRVNRIFIDYYQSIGIYINDTLIPYQEFDESLFNPPTPQTGVFEYVNLTDWSIRENIDITQEDPLPMTILAIGYELEVKQ